MFPYPINDLLHELGEVGAIECSNGAVSLHDLMGTLEKKVILGVLGIFNGNKSRTSRYLKISRVKLDYMLKEYGR